MLAKVDSSSLPKLKILGELRVPRSTYYRWLRRKEQQGLEDDVGGGNPPWNKLSSREVSFVLSAAREKPELSYRQLAAWITDNMGFSVSESTVYRILRRERLMKRPELRLAAGKEYHRKTTRLDKIKNFRDQLQVGHITAELHLYSPKGPDELPGFHGPSTAGLTLSSNRYHQILFFRRGFLGCVIC